MRTWRGARVCRRRSKPGPVECIFPLVAGVEWPEARRHRQYQIHQGRHDEIRHRSGRLRVGPARLRPSRRCRRIHTFKYKFYLGRSGDHRGARRQAGLPGNHRRPDQLDRRAQGHLRVLQWRPGCSLVKGSGLPWTAIATGATTLTISKVSFILSGGLCGPGVIPANLGGGVLAFNAVNNFAGCSIAGGLRSAPPIRIVP